MDRLWGWGLHSITVILCGGRRVTSLCPTRRVSAAGPCLAQPLPSAMHWWTRTSMRPPAFRICAAAPPAHVPPLLSTPASVPMQGDSRRTGGALTSAVSTPQGLDQGMHWDQPQVLHPCWVPGRSGRRPWQVWQGHRAGRATRGAHRERVGRGAEGNVPGPGPGGMVRPYDPSPTASPGRGLGAQGEALETRGSRLSPGF